MADAPAIHIPGDSIRSKKDAEKLLKDVNANVVNDGWNEHMEKLDNKDKAYNKEMYKIMKDHVRDRVFCTRWPDGLYEKIFPNGRGVEKTAGERGEK